MSAEMQADTLSTPGGKGDVSNQPAICVPLGSGFLNAHYSGLASGFIGRWHINVAALSETPASTAAPVGVFIDRSPSNVVR